MKITHLKLTDLKLADYNPRIMPNDEMEALKKSIEVFGLVEPIVINNIVIGGHQRIAAVKDNPKYETLPTIVVDLHLPQEMQLNIALNKIGGRFDTIKLKHLIREIHALSPKANLTITGFSPKEIANILEPIEMPELAAWAKVPDGDQPDYTLMSFTVNTRQAGEILKAINAIRKKYETLDGSNEEQTLGYALVALSAHYIKHHGERNKTT